ncbi:polysaccharide pyruvyl transferase family protein [Microbacterium sp. zg.Y909]|uniref:polysaccharide pyruvyl transferase family protein n=1 Tax=Microbacterium sp. zg.Y909 TaxID=2969413 RepID=UPI0035A98D96
MHTSHTSLADSSGAPGVALLGAFERDNFGDVLFLQLTRELLAHDDPKVTAPFDAQNGFRPLGIDVQQYLRGWAAGPDTVWMVGGEVGGTSMEDAYRMSASDERYGAYLERARRGRAKWIAATTSRSIYSAAYLPRMSASSLTRHSHFVVNSAGLSALRGLRGLRRDEAWGAIKEASYVSVRDAASSSALSRYGVDHDLTPDLVHSLRDTRPGWLIPATESQPYALVQVKESVLEDHGPERLADTLMSSRELRSYEIRLFVAGTARGHDSVRLYERVVERARRSHPGREISILEVNTAIEKAESIARASLWIGTSLHGWIISSSFEVPRVGLSLEKVARYARTWNDPMPTAVPLASLPDAVEIARKRSEVPGRAEEMSALALAGFRRAETATQRALPREQGDYRAAAATGMARKSRSLAHVGWTNTVDELKKWRHR